MAVHFKMVLALATLTAALAGRDTRNEDKSDDMEREEISRRQWQYYGSVPMQQQETRRRNSEPEDSRSRNGPEEPQRKRSQPKEPRRRREEPSEPRRMRDKTEEPRRMRDELEESQKRDESDDPQQEEEAEEPQIMRDESEDLRRRKGESEDPRRSSNESEEPRTRRDELQEPRRSRDKLEDPRKRNNESEDPRQRRIEPKEPGRRRNELEEASGSKTPKTTERPTTSRTTTTTEIPTTVAAEHPTPMLPPLNKRYRRIYNADETAKIENYPYLAAVLMNNELWCGGAIITSDLVLTAAHCLQLKQFKNCKNKKRQGNHMKNPILKNDPQLVMDEVRQNAWIYFRCQYNNRFFREYVKMLTVRVGSSNATAGGEHLSVDEIFFHPNYKPQTLEFNYALLRLHKNISFDGPNVSKIEYSKRRDVPIDKTVTFLGWGSVLGMGDKGGAVLLQKVDLPVYDKADCVDVYGRDLVTASNFCAGYISKMKNVCNHDAGGPATMDGQLVGILSFSSKRCDEPDRPAVFASTGAAAEWLESIPDIRKKSDELQQGWMNVED